MTTIANVTVKKNDGVTDVTFTAQQGASGDNPAQWFAPALGATGATRPEVRFITKRSASRPSQSRVIGTMMMPYAVVNTTTGVTSVEKRLIGRVEVPFDADIPSTVQDEFVSQLVNFCASAHAKAQFKEGQAAT